MNKVIVICGPTATGKSALAVEIAKQYNGEIISADSRQVYTGLDIGSAKITQSEMEGIPHYMINVADPREIFTVAEYQKQAREKMRSIFSRGKVPIICGGTGMYISALIDNTAFPEVPPNPELRAQLESLTAAELVQKLEQLNPNRLETIDQKNRVRLVRAIEIANHLQAHIPLSPTDTLPYQGEDFSVLSIGLTLPKEVLIDRIITRINNRIPALFNEIETLHHQGVSIERLESFGLEYRHGSEYVQGKITLEQFKEILATKTWQFVRRQMTWFKRDTRIHWMNPISDNQKILELVQDFLK